MNLNTAYRATELEYALNETRCNALITADAFKSNDYLATLRSLALEIGSCAPGELKAGDVTMMATPVWAFEGTLRKNVTESN